MPEPTLRQELVALAYGMHPEVFEAVLTLFERRLAEAKKDCENDHHIKR